MADRSRDGAERDAEDTDELLYNDLDHTNGVFGLGNLSLKQDHCDLLLDAIDAQLGQLQVQPQKCQTISREHDSSVAAHLRWGHSLSKDTGLGSTTHTNDTPMSCLDLTHTPTVENSSEKSTKCRESPVVNEETKKRLDKRPGDKEEIESRREQVIWRLERLLGDTCKEDGLAGNMQPPSDSICTEDFVRRFREEMVEPAFPVSNMCQLDMEEDAVRTELSDSDTCQSEQKGQTVFNFERRGSTVTGKSSKATMSAPYFQSNMPHERKKLEKPLSVSYGINMSHVSEKAGAEERYKPPKRADDSSSKVPVRSFDTVSTDSDLDSVCTDQVRQHIHRQLGWCALIQSVMGTDDYCTKKSDYDTPKQEESEPLSTSGKKCEKEEETLRFKRNQLKDMELCLSELQQRRKHALQELDRLAADTAQMEKEKRTLECVLIDSKKERNSISCQLQKLQKQRESFVLEVREMEKELVTLHQHKQTLTAGSCTERNSIIMSVLEREEMERQLDNAKTELFAEQRRAREELELMQEKLEETCELLQRATEAEISLRNKCACLEEKQVQKKVQIKVHEARVSELQVELGETKIRLGSLEKMLAQKERQLVDFQKQCGALQAERDGLNVELQQLKTTYYKTLKESQEQAHRMMQAEEGKVSALKEQTTSLTQRIEFMQSSIQLKEEEAMQLRKYLEQQREEAKNHEEQLHAEALKKVHKVIDEERRTWEAEKLEAVQVHCRILEEQNRKSLEHMRSEMQQEKSKALAIQHKVLELKTKVQELESERCAQQREQESLLPGICKSLKEDHQAELHRLQKQMAQESQKTVLRLEQAVQLAENEADRLRVMLKERESSHNQITAELDQQLRTWAQELGTECQHLYLLVEQCGAKQNALQLPLSPSVAEALTNLRTLREQLKNLISHLYQELDSQKQTSQQLRKDKERELSIQRQQLKVERDQALGFLKEHLIQEHIEDLSRLNWAHMRGGGVAESLRRQLKAKDLELRQVQKTIGQWKEQTAPRLTCELKEELTAELERKASSIHQERQQMSEGTEAEMTFSAREAQNSFCSPSILPVDSAASYSPSDVALLKLLHYLQRTVKQLCVENQANTCNSASLDAIPLDLPGSPLTMITQGQDSAAI